MGTPETRTVGWEPGCDCERCDVCGRDSSECVGCKGETGAHQQLTPYFPIPCTVLDPFGGSGTTGQVALELGRKAILCELSPEYVKLIEKRTHVTPGLQLA